MSGGLFNNFVIRLKSILFYFVCEHKRLIIETQSFRAAQRTEKFFFSVAFILIDLGQN
jgi:hypothetical protein